MGFFSLLIMKIGKMLFGKLKELEVGIQWGESTGLMMMTSHSINSKRNNGGNHQSMPLLGTLVAKSSQNIMPRNDYMQFLLNSQQYNI